MGTRKLVHMMPIRKKWWPDWQSIYLSGCVANNLPDVKIIERILTCAAKIFTIVRFDTGCVGANIFNIYRARFTISIDGFAGCDTIPRTPNINFCYD